MKHLCVCVCVCDYNVACVNVGKRSIYFVPHFPAQGHTHTNLLPHKMSLYFTLASLHLDTL